jgi:hypothetical protein
MPIGSGGRSPVVGWVVRGRVRRVPERSLGRRFGGRLSGPWAGYAGCLNGPWGGAGGVGVARW